MGAITIASTSWLMKLRTAAICAAGSLSAALKMRSKPLSLENAFFIASVFALRHPDSEPVCAKPTLMALPSVLAAAPALLAVAELVSPPLEELLQPVMARDRAPRMTAPATNFFFTQTSSTWTGKPSRLGEASPHGPDVSPNIFRSGRMLSITSW